MLSFKEPIFFENSTFKASITNFVLELRKFIFFVYLWKLLATLHLVAIGYTFFGYYWLFCWLLFWVLLFRYTHYTLFHSLTHQYSDQSTWSRDFIFWWFSNGVGVRLEKILPKSPLRGKKGVNVFLRDWMIHRQRFWTTEVRSMKFGEKSRIMMWSYT